MYTSSPIIVLANILNLLICLLLTLINLSSLTLFMNSLHLSIVVVVNIDNSLDLQLCTLTSVSHRMPMMYLILSWWNCFSALCMISLTDLLLLLLVDFNLTLTGIKSLLMHLKVHGLWFLYSLSSITHFSHSLSSCRASIPGFSLINVCRFIILLCYVGQYRGKSFKISLSSVSYLGVILLHL